MANSAQYANLPMANAPIEIYVAAHKPYWMPSGPMYQPIHVGHALHPETDLGFGGDDVGENISEKNESYCELTAVYWMWKNAYADYLGLVHYRRYFADPRAALTAKKQDKILTEVHALELLSEYDVIVPSPRRYYIETVYSQYAHAHPVEVLDFALERVRARTPEYREAIDAVMNRTWLHLYNMWVAPDEVFKSYCAWLFPILADVDKHVDTTAFDSYNKRALGFLSERLFNVWLEHAMAAGLTTYRLPIVNLESQHWGLKAADFMKRKLEGTVDQGATPSTEA